MDQIHGVTALENQQVKQLVINEHGQHGGSLDQPKLIITGFVRSFPPGHGNQILSQNGLTRLSHAKVAPWQGARQAYHDGGPA